MEKKISKLISYCNDKNLIRKRDNIYAYNLVASTIKYIPTKSFEYINTNDHIDDLLNDIVSDMTFDNNTDQELFKTYIIGSIIERPSNIEDIFNYLYKEDKISATDWYYKFAKDINYVKTREIKKNIAYKVNSEYGEIDITINLSKPEKTPEEIKTLKEAKSTNFPPCFLCIEHEGNYGDIKNPDRSNHRVIKTSLNNEDWYLQYSPYAYFNEHAIVFKQTHSDMIINENTFKKLIEFVDKYPHYMIGSNADLPIVGGSMLTHDHYQAGRAEFPIFHAKSNSVKEVNNVEIHSVNWPMHTIKLISQDKDSLENLINITFNKWINYQDIDNQIFNTKNQRHNTITPIIRFNDNQYEAYLILRNNKTNDDHPDGIYHVNSSRHHIKKENIGLIEAMGLAVLPSRLKYELEEIANGNIVDIHMPLIDKLKIDKPEDKLDYLYQEVGNIFIDALKDCGVFKYDETKYLDFIKDINA